MSLVRRSSFSSRCKSNLDTGCQPRESEAVDPAGWPCRRRRCCSPGKPDGEIHRHAGVESNALHGAERRQGRPRALSPAPARSAAHRRHPPPPLPLPPPTHPRPGPLRRRRPPPAPSRNGRHALRPRPAAPQSGVQGRRAPQPGPQPRTRTVGPLHNTPPLPAGPPTAWPRGHAAAEPQGPRPLARGPAARRRPTAAAKPVATGHCGQGGAVATPCWPTCHCHGPRPSRPATSSRSRARHATLHTHPFPLSHHLTLPS